MRLHPGRGLGIIVGIAVLATVFFVPFLGSSTLYGKAGPLLTDTPSIQVGSTAMIVSNYVLVISFVLLVIAGVVGIFPLGTGVLGVVAMAMLTVGPYLIYPSIGQGSYGAAFYLLWVESIVALGASFWHRRKRDVIVQNQPTSAPSTSQPSS